MSDRQILLSVAIMAVVTLATRALAFLVFRGGRTPAVITYLGRVLPYAVMGMLVVYGFKDIAFTSVGAFLPQLIAGAAVALSYLWKRNLLVSVIGGTVLYMLLVQLVF